MHISCKKNFFVCFLQPSQWIKWLFFFLVSTGSSYKVEQWKEMHRQRHGRVGKDKKWIKREKTGKRNGPRCEKRRRAFLVYASIHSTLYFHREKNFQSFILRQGATVREEKWYRKKAILLQKEQLASDDDNPNKKSKSAFGLAWRYKRKRDR